MSPKLRAGVCFTICRLTMGQLSNLNKLGLPLLQGLFSFLIVAFGIPSFSPFLALLTSFIGYALFWQCVRAFISRLQRFFLGVIWYASLSLIHLSWMTSIEYQGVYILFVWLLLSFWLGLQFGLLTLFIPCGQSLSSNQDLKAPRILAMAAFWSLLEWSRFYFLCGYSWNLTGMALSNLYSSQMASLFGVLGLSFWVILTNLVGLSAFKKKKISAYLVWAGLALVPYIFGFFHLSYHEKKMKGRASCETLHCALAQTGLLPSQKVPLSKKIEAFISPYEQWEWIVRILADKRGAPLDLILLPEAAVPFSSGALVYKKGIVDEIFKKNFYLKSPGSNAALSTSDGKNRVSNLYWAQKLSDALGTDLVIGLDHHEKGGSTGKGCSYNSAFFIRPCNVASSQEEVAQRVGRYDKQILMPLAEYLPFPFLESWVLSYGVTGFFTKGKGPQIFEGKVPFSPSICYEETFPHKVREGKNLGARLLVNLTNDGWYPSSRLPSQHFEHARFRAVENGTPLLRACNTGVSAAVDSLGRTLVHMPEQDQKGKALSGVIFTRVDLYNYLTLYSLWGNSGVVSISLIFLTVFFLFKNRRSW